MWSGCCIVKDETLNVKIYLFLTNCTPFDKCVYYYLPKMFQLLLIAILRVTVDTKHLVLQCVIVIEPNSCTCF
jgi:hypothetical protein